MAKRAKATSAVTQSPPASPQVQAEIDRRLAMSYTYELIPDDGCWFIRIVEFPGCMSQGNDVEDAMRMIKEAVGLWLQVAIEDGVPIPDPVDLDDYSGRFLARVPQSLHRDLARRAEREGVSLNTFAVTALARAIGQES